MMAISTSAKTSWITATTLSHFSLSSPHLMRGIHMQLSHPMHCSHSGLSGHKERSGGSRRYMYRLVEVANLGHLEN